VRKQQRATNGCSVPATNNEPNQSWIVSFSVAASKFIVDAAADEALVEFDGDVGNDGRSICIAMAQSTEQSDMMAIPLLFWSQNFGNLSVIVRRIHFAVDSLPGG
jgi:hypothetical protein